MNNNKINTINKPILSIFTAIFLSSGLYAQQVPTSGTILNETKIQSPIKKDIKAPKFEVAPLRAPIKLKDDFSTFIKKIKITNNSKISKSELDPFIKEYENKKLSFSQLKELTYKISKYYREKGYMVARAYIPQQDLKNKIVEISIIEGRYGDFIINNNSKVEDKVIKNTLELAKETEVIKNDKLQRVLLNLAKTPGIIIEKSELKAGTKVGTSDFIINIEADKQIKSYLLFDNHGSIYTGKYRLSAGVDINTPFNIGDKLSLSGILSNKTSLKNAQIIYSLPLHPNGLKADLSYAKTTYSLEDQYKSLDALGQADIAKINLSYPLIRSQQTEVLPYISYAYSDFKDEVRSTSTTTLKDSSVATVGINGYTLLDALNLNHQLSFDFAYSNGNLEIKDAASKAIDKAGANTDGDFDKIYTQVSLYTTINSYSSLQTTFKMQKALGKNLDGSEDFSAGGINGVKAYPSGELSAENGYYLGLEYFYHLRDYNSKFSIFTDIARATMEDKISTFNARTLKDVGIGYYYNYDNISFKLNLAQAIDKDTNTDTENNDLDNPKLLFQLSYIF